MLALSLAAQAHFGKVCQGRGESHSSDVNKETEVENLRDFLRISEAAEYLGVSKNTLRNWTNAGKIAAHRHPVNDYRLFKTEELDALLQQLQEPPSSSNRKPK